MLRSENSVLYKLHGSVSSASPPVVGYINEFSCIFLEYLVYPYTFPMQRTSPVLVRSEVDFGQQMLVPD